MVRSRRWSVVVLLGALASLGGSPAADPPAEEKWVFDKALTVAPQAVAPPALKYRLFPLSSELKAGNAVPIYLRMVHEQNDAARRHWSQTPLPWLDLPLRDLPLDEAAPPSREQQKAKARQHAKQVRKERRGERRTRRRG